MKRYFLCTMVLLISLLFTGCSSLNNKTCSNPKLSDTSHLKINYSLLGKGKCENCLIGKCEGKFVLKFSFSNLPDSVSILYPIDMSKELYYDEYYETPITFKDLSDPQTRITVELLDLSNLDRDPTEIMIREISKFIFIKVGKKIIKQPIVNFVYSQVVNLVFKEVFPFNNEIIVCGSWKDPRPSLEIDRSDLAYTKIFRQEVLNIDYPKLKIKLFWE